MGNSGQRQHFGQFPDRVDSSLQTAIGKKPDTAISLQSRQRRNWPDAEVAPKCAACSLALPDVFADFSGTIDFRRVHDKHLA